MPTTLRLLNEHRCLTILLALEAEREPVSMTAFTRLSDLPPRSARKARDLLLACGLLQAKRDPKRGASAQLRISLTAHGQRASAMAGMLDSILRHPLKEER